MGLHQGVVDGAAGLATLTPQQLEEFCSMLPLVAAPGTAEKKLKRKLTRHASQYGWSAVDLDKATSSLCFIFADAAKRGSSAQELVTSLMALRLSHDHLGVLAAYYEAQREAIKAATAWNPSLDVPAYHDLSWRLDMEVGTRLLHHKASPALSLSLETREKHGAVAARTMAADYATLRTLHASLKDALKEAQSTHCGRVQRYLQ
ncbi:hypothetical protein SPRG_20043 [Saprolegnia parasitica CBS 223.65]|uniref:COMM domain-containing protein n=1 Tax=Saprolegnia parasitica (strain CBS 223.65) TaxID=695850 RepID=A0A067CDL1_SAPPC|nr:hypothetical protein SPRG_20043 [Saprolegnia parasitica CBS 223.65]KDO28844.1 hypothetical protein SPRG_20043 [Saprolegnia parasitica CBS 223.65]|eukprot:XP_012200571.1 hypothetical protein SPRG_20043 [Saprolegnia parasitica CBS 223.65]